MSTKLLYLLFILCLINFPTSTQAQICGNLSLTDITNPGPYDYATMNQNDGIRNGPDYGNATIYYPTNATPPFSNPTTPFASVAIVPGFFATQSRIEAWGPFLASHGIVAMIFDTNSLFDSPEDRADGLIDALETIRQENVRSTSPLFGNLDINRFGVMGWSMGGGGAQLAAVLDPSIKSVIALCPWLSSPNSSDLDHTVPVLIFSGEDDPTAPPNQHADIHYSLTPNTTDKLLFEVASGNHSVANDPANVQGEIGQYGLSWLRYFLLGDPCHCPLTIEPSTSTSENLTNVVCPNTSCPIQLSISNNPITDGTYYANQTITSTGVVPALGIVSFKAGQSISLDPGFEVDLGADFEAIIEACQ